MLFLLSPGGMGITPIIKLPVVNGTFIPLLLLPHSHGFGTNESQISDYFDNCMAVFMNEICSIEDVFLGIYLKRTKIFKTIC